MTKIKIQLPFFGFLLIVGPMAFAQRISLDEAVKQALQNNLGIKAAEYRIDYFKESKKTATDIGKLSAMWMHGQYNSIYQDNNFTFLQNIPFPTTLASQVKLGKEQVSGAEKDLVVQQNNLALEVKSAYYQLLYQEALRTVLQRQDSLFNDFANASAARYKAGESNLLEKTTAETQRMEAQNILAQNEADIQITKAKLQVLLKIAQPVDVSEKLSKRTAPIELDSLSVRNNPELKLMTQEVKIADQIKRVERNRIMPDLMIGGFAQSLTGNFLIDGQEVFFPPSKVFTGFQFGLAIPLWIKPNLARAKAASFQEASAQKSAENVEALLAGNLVQASRQLDKNTGVLTYYEKNALANANLILSQAKKAFHGGEIGYIEYLQALRNANSIHTNYLTALNQYNQTVVKIEFLLGKI